MENLPSVIAACAISYAYVDSVAMTSTTETVIEILKQGPEGAGSNAEGEAGGDPGRV